MSEKTQSTTDEETTAREEVRVAEEHVKLDIFVKETRRKLCTVSLPETSTLNQVKEQIIKQNLRVIVKNLYITEKDTKPRMIVVYLKQTVWEEFRGLASTCLRWLGLRNGSQARLCVRFVRGLALLTEEQREVLIARIDKKVQGKYPRELIVQSVNMAPECTFDQTLSNLVNNTTRVFESILQAECREILHEVKAIREQAVYPTCRIRYQIIGEQYRQMIMQTFRTTLPNVNAHLERRVHFADYLLQVGIFSDPNLDRRHREVYERILNQYLERYNEASRLRPLGIDPEKETQHSSTDPSDEARTGRGTEGDEAALMPVTMLDEVSIVADKDELFSDGSFAQDLEWYALIRD